jgi:FKBP-type peptidyl-prolyl cis-trans isomerase
MLKINQLITILMLVITVGCSQDEFTTTDTGLTYKYLAKGSGERPADGDYLTMHIAYFAEDGHKIYSSADKNELSALGYVDSLMVANGSLEECFRFIGKGDSVMLVVNSEKLFTESFRRPLPDTIAADSKITIYIGIHDVYTPEEFQQYRMEEYQKAQEKAAVAAGEQLEKDIAEIDAFLQKEGLEAIALEEGLRYIILEDGTGEYPVDGQRVRVNYTGSLLTGEMFDSNNPEDAKRGNVFDERRNYEPFEFVLGQGSVIKGWDLGVGLIKEGTKARLYIPSVLAYGPRQRSAVIKENAILVFDVELLDIVE